MAAERELPFALLADPDCVAIRAFGLLHPAAGPGGADISIPAHLLIRSDGSFAWRYVSTRINDRVPPEAVERAIDGL